MKLVKCKKCGATIMTGDTLLQNMQDKISDLSNSSRNDRNKQRLYDAEISSIKQLMKSLLHNISWVEKTKIESEYAYRELKKYLLDNNILDESTIIEILKKADQKAEIERIEAEKRISRIYGNYNAVASNKTMSDKTANKAIKNSI